MSGSARRKSRELLDHRRFFRRVRRNRAREVPDRRRAVLRDRATRIALRARQVDADNARPEATPCPSAQNPFGSGVCSDQRDTPRAATGEEAFGPGLNESEAKIGYRALSHKDAHRHQPRRVTLRCTSRNRPLVIDIATSAVHRDLDRRSSSQLFRIQRARALESPTQRLGLANGALHS